MFLTFIRFNRLLEFPTNNLLYVFLVVKKFLGNRPKLLASSFKRRSLFQILKIKYWGGFDLFQDFMSKNRQTPQQKFLTVWMLTDLSVRSNLNSNLDICSLRTLF